MKPISKSHAEFIRLVSEGTNQDEAYLATVGNNKVTRSTARAKGSQLAKRYASQIAAEREKIQKIVEGAKDSEVVKNALKSVLSQAEVDAKLSAIINGDLLEVQQLNLSTGKTYKAKVTPTVSDINKAIDTYYKRFGSNAPATIDLTTKGKGIKSIIVERVRHNPNK